MKKDRLLLGLSLIILLTVLFLIDYYIFYQKIDKKIIGNTKILNEINNLLLPLSSKNLTESDFNKLKSLAKDDEYAVNKLSELAILAKYKEYAHIGHALGFLYEYIKTGKESICPGHNLAHYYVFLFHGENEIAEENLDEARNNTNKMQNSAYLSLFNYTINQINSGNISVTNTQITELSESPCIN